MENISCIILAGGESSRMGEDKGLKLFNNQALVTYSIRLAKELCKTIYISTNETDYEQFGFPLLNDVFIKKGPMSGIYSGLLASKTNWNLFLPCDTPFLKSDILLEMKEQLGTNKIAVPITENGRIHPLIGFYHKDLLPIIQNHLENNRLKILGLLNETKTHYQKIEQKNTPYFLNINTIEELRNSEL